MQIVGACLGLRHPLVDLRDVLEKHRSRLLGGVDESDEYGSAALNLFMNVNFDWHVLAHRRCSGFLATLAGSIVSADLVYRHGGNWQENGRSGLRFSACLPAGALLEQCLQ